MATAEPGPQRPTDSFSDTSSRITAVLAEYSDRIQAFDRRRSR
ncbi:MAG: hypothetical protein ABEI57_00640 [Halapricum sp.]